jgi:hypothetical protein
MKATPANALAVVLSALVCACRPAEPVDEGPGLVMASLSAAPLRPFQGFCAITVSPRVHDSAGGGCGGGEDGGCGGDEGGCGGGGEEEPGGGPPIARHFDLGGTCHLTHLGLSQVTGRLNLTGPFGAGGGEAGHATLGARGRLAFVAANGDQLVGRYVPIVAAFTPADGDGGVVAFTSVQDINQSCEGGGGGHADSTGEGETHEEPVSTGRFSAATGQDTLLGVLRISGSTDSGAGTIQITGGRLSY